MELIEYLSEIINVEANSSPPYEVFDIDECVHFFFDDTDLSGNLSGEVGYALFDEAEAVAVKRVTDLLDAVIAELNDAETACFLAHPKWPDVQREAKEALHVVLQKGRPRAKK